MGQPCLSLCTHSTSLRSHIHSSTLPLSVQPPHLFAISSHICSSTLAAALTLPLAFSQSPSPSPNSRPSFLLPDLVLSTQSIGQSLMAAQKLGEQTGKKYALETFILGRSRLENQGCVAISKALAVGVAAVETRHHSQAAPRGIILLRLCRTPVCIQVRHQFHR